MVAISGANFRRAGLDESKIPLLGAFEGFFPEGMEVTREDLHRVATLFIPAEYLMSVLFPQGHPAWDQFTRARERADVKLDGAIRLAREEREGSLALVIARLLEIS